MTNDLQKKFLLGAAWIIWNVLSARRSNEKKAVISGAIEIFPILNYKQWFHVI